MNGGYLGGRRQAVKIVICEMHQLCVKFPAKGARWVIGVDLIRDGMGALPPRADALTPGIFLKK